MPRLPILIITSCCILWLAFFRLMGFVTLKDAPRQVIKDSLFIQNEIKPLVRAITEFKQAHHYLPDDSEFGNLQHRVHIELQTGKKLPADTLLKDDGSLGGAIYIHSDSQVDDELAPYVDNVDWNKDYALAVWRGEWMEYYMSWSNSYKGNGYTLQDGVSGLRDNIIIGLLPLTILLITILLKRRFRNPSSA